MATPFEEMAEKIKALEAENTQLKEHLKKYTAPVRSKKYYQEHKEELLQKMKENPTPKEKQKEYNRISYLRRKEKLKAAEAAQNV